MKAEARSTLAETSKYTVELFITTPLGLNIIQKPAMSPTRMKLEKKNRAVSLTKFLRVTGLNAISIITQAATSLPIVLAAKFSSSARITSEYAPPAKEASTFL